MVNGRYLVVKLPPEMEILPCLGSGCNISTNKRYRQPAGLGIVACCFDHAEAVYMRRNGKAAAAPNGKE